MITNRILQIQRKLTPKRRVLELVHYLLILISLTISLGWFGLIPFVIYVFCIWEFNVMSKIQTDKLEHFYWGVIYTLAGMIPLIFWDWKFSVLVPSLVLGASKEIRVWFGYGKPEILDFVFTVIPSLIVVGLLHL